MTVDGLTFLGVSRFGYARTVDETLRAMDAEDIETAVVTPMHPVDGDLASANDDLARIAADSGGRFAWLARIDPWDRDPGRMSDAVRSGARGVFLHPAEEHYRINDPVVRPVAEQVAELGVPVVVATGFPWFAETPQVARFARWCPDVPLVMTNGGQLNISGMGEFDATRALAAPNTHVFTSGMYRNDFLERAIGAFGAERLLFASGAPRLDIGYELRRVHQIRMTDEQRDLVLAGNARRLFGPA
jgi:hypothetical protein